MKILLQRGQIALLPAIIGAISLLGASMFTAWATANNKVGAIDTKIQVVEEREQNRYLELKESNIRIERKLDRLIEQLK